MHIRFDGKTVVVSGAGHGFGRCIADTFAALGARVFGCDLAAAELAETAKAGVSTELVDLADRAAAAQPVLNGEAMPDPAPDGVTGQRIAKATINYAPQQRAADAARWLRGELSIKPTVALAARTFGVSVPLAESNL